MSIRCRGGRPLRVSGRRIEGPPPEGRVELPALGRGAAGRDAALDLDVEGLVLDFERETALDRDLALFDLELADDLDEVLLDLEPLDLAPLDRAPLDRLLPLLDFAELPEEPEDFEVVFSF
ncbi:MAG: hypothetical protein V3T72_11845 [Thermoanaerobaculia bacterium]